MGDISETNDPFFFLEELNIHERCKWFLFPIAWSLLSESTKPPTQSRQTYFPLGHIDGGRLESLRPCIGELIWGWSSSDAVWCGRLFSTTRRRSCVKNQFLSRYKISPPTADRAWPQSERLWWSEVTFIRNYLTSELIGFSWFVRVAYSIMTHVLLRGYPSWCKTERKTCFWNSAYYSIIIILLIHCLGSGGCHGANNNVY